MRQSKTIYLVFFLIALLITLVLVQIFKSPNLATKKTVQEALKTTPVYTLKIIKTNLGSKPLDVIGPLTIQFDKPVANEDLNLEIIPEESILPLFNDNLTILTIKPANAWNFDTIYTIKIFKSTKSKGDLLLDKDYEFIFKTVPYTGI